MAEAAGVALGVLALWKNCVAVFDMIDSSRRYGMDYEVLCVKLEVERVRLLCWGDAVGLNGGRDDQQSAEVRFSRIEVKMAVVRLLGCIQQVFEDSERLQESYGLQPLTAAGTTGGNEVQLTQSQLILGGVFKRTYQTLRRVARDRQRTTPLARKTLWAIHDRKKFLQLVEEIHGFNDSLENLFPDVKARATEIIIEEIDSSAQVDELRLLQEATSEGHEVISESASVRLEALGATASARTELLSQSNGEHDAATIRDDEEADEEVLREGADREQSAPPSDGPIDELSKQLRDVELYVQKKSTGALTLGVVGPSRYTEHVSANVYWDQDERGSSFSRIWDAKDKGFIQLDHASFELYHRKKYMRKQRSRSDYDYIIPDSEDHVLLDVESHAKYENINPGTITVEGFGMECWDFEHTKPRNHTILVNSSEMPSLPARKLLRRLDELQRGGNKLGWNPEQDELDIKEFVGTLGITYYDQKYARDPKRWVGDLYSVLNRTDIFADFKDASSIGLQWAAPKDSGSIGLWNMLWQIIIAKELARRLDHHEGSTYTGFTSRILASLIVADLLLTNVGIILTDANFPTADIKKLETEAEKAEAEDFKNKGNEALKQKQYQDAFDFYTQAIKIDLGNAVYRCNRSAASFANDKFEEAEEDAYVATQLDPKYAKAWSRLGAAQLKQDAAKRAEISFKKALELAGDDATAQMRQGLKAAQDKVEATVKAINAEKDKEQQHKMISDYRDQDFDTFGKSIELHSHVHERQVEGLLRFAEDMKWPYINEVRDYAEDIYANLRGGEVLNINMHDWLFGMVLPGKWFAFKLMTALILSTASIKKIGVSMYYESGLSLPKRSYWRCRTVLGRVLGCLPGVRSLCGWIGPCPPVEFSCAETAEKRPQHVRLRTRRLAPYKHKPDSDDVIFVGSGRDRYEGTRIKPDEETEPYLADMKEPSRWVIPEPPIQEISTCELQSIVLKKLPLEASLAQQAANGELSEEKLENETQYRASVVFKIDSKSEPITYQLYTNPVFVTLPPCRPGPKGVCHEVHMRELPRFQKNIWAIEQLKDHTPEDTDNDTPLIINATGKGAELLARAWCSERGKNAVIRREGGPCFVCAVRAAGKASLETGVLIWLE